LFGMLSVIAQFETELRAERQREGIEKAKRAGIHFGRTKALTPEQAAELCALRAEGVTLATLMQRYGIGKTAGYRYLGQSVTKYNERNSQPHADGILLLHLQHDRAGPSGSDRPSRGLRAL